MKLSAHAKLALKSLRAVTILVAVTAFTAAGPSHGQQLETLNVSYASVTGSRIPLWIAKDSGLPTVPEMRGKRVADFIDKSILSDLEREGFFRSTRKQIR